MPAVDVVVLTWNDGPLLATAVASAVVDAEIMTTIVVVDNASDTEPALPAATHVTLRRNDENRGVAAGRNQGVALGDSPLVLLLDSDAELEPGCLRALATTLADDPSIGMAVPVYAGQPVAATAGRTPSLARKAARGFGLTANYRGVRRPPDATTWNVDFGIGACQLIRRDAWARVGGLDEAFFYGPEDVDFCVRLRDAGYRIVQRADAVCRHPARRRNRSLFAPGGLRHARALARFYAGRMRRSPR